MGIYDDLEIDFNKKHKRALMLNADTLPIATITWKSAITLLVKEQADILDFYNGDFITSPGRRWPVPAVIRSREYINAKKRNVSFSKKNVCIRDNMQCQYCGHKFHDISEVTFDHVLPKSQWYNKDIKGTSTRWTNIVTCCYSCNSKKANRTPGEAGMRLLKKPIEPDISKYILGLNPWTPIEPEWEPYVKYVWKNYSIKRETLNQSK